MSAKRGLGYQTMLSVVLGPDNAARAAFMVGTGCEWSASEVALRDDVRKDFVRVRGTKAETRDRDVPLVRVWQRELVDYALEHGMGKDGLLFRPNTSFTHALYRACDCVNSTRAIASVMAFCSLGAACRWPKLDPT